MTLIDDLAATNDVALAVTSALEQLLGDDVILAVGVAQIARRRPRRCCPTAPTRVGRAAVRRRHRRRDRARSSREQLATDDGSRAPPTSSLDVEHAPPRSKPARDARSSGARRPARRRTLGRAATRGRRSDDDASCVVDGVATFRRRTRCSQRRRARRVPRDRAVADSTATTRRHVRSTSRCTSSSRSATARRRSAAAARSRSSTTSRWTSPPSSAAAA